MNIAIKIKELRESVGMTRKEFAEYTGIPIRTLEDWEAERRIPPAYVLSESAISANFCKAICLHSREKCAPVQANISECIRASCIIRWGRGAA